MKILFLPNLSCRSLISRNPSGRLIFQLFAFLCKKVCGVATHLKSPCMLIRLGERRNYAMNMERTSTTVVSLDILCRAFQRDNVSRECGHQSSLDAVVSIRCISRICIYHKLRYFWMSS